MRIMVLGLAECAVDLGMRLAESREVPLIRVGIGETVTDLEQQLENAAAAGGFLLQGGPAAVEQAVELDSLLDGLGAPMDLVLEIDTALENPAARSAGLAPEIAPLSQYYRDRGLLRRVRGEGEASDRLVAADRIADDWALARRREGADPFTAALQALSRETPEEAPSSSTQPAAGKEERQVEPTAEPDATVRSAPSPAGGWKRTADRKGRLRRQPPAKKGGRKPRR